MSEDQDLEKLISNLEFENQQYIRLIEKENQQVRALEDEIAFKKSETIRLQDSTSQLDAKTKLLHRQFTTNRDNYESLKKTVTVLGDHENALKSKVEALQFKRETKRAERKTIIAHYQKMWENYHSKYESLSKAQNLKASKEASSKAEETLASVTALKTELENKKKKLQGILEGYTPATTYQEFAINIAEIKVKMANTMKCTEDNEERLQALLLEKDELLKLVKEETERRRVQDEEARKQMEINSKHLSPEIIKQTSPTEDRSASQTGTSNDVEQPMQTVSSNHDQGHPPMLTSPSSRSQAQRDCVQQPTAGQAQRDRVQQPTAGQAQHQSAHPQAINHIVTSYNAQQLVSPIVHTQQASLQPQCDKNQSPRLVTQPRQLAPLSTQLFATMPTQTQITPISSYFPPHQMSTPNRQQSVTPTSSHYSVSVPNPFVQSQPRLESAVLQSRPDSSSNQSRPDDSIGYSRPTAQLSTPKSGFVGAVENIGPVLEVPMLSPRPSTSFTTSQQVQRLPSVYLPRHKTPPRIRMPSSGDLQNNRAQTYTVPVIEPVYATNLSGHLRPSEPMKVGVPSSPVQNEPIKMVVPSTPVRHEPIEMDVPSTLVQSEPIQMAVPSTPSGSKSQQEKFLQSTTLTSSGQRPVTPTCGSTPGTPSNSHYKTPPKSPWGSDSDSPFDLEKVMERMRLLAENKSPGFRFSSRPHTGGGDAGNLQANKNTDSSFMQPFFNMDTQPGSSVIDFFGPASPTAESSPGGFSFGAGFGGGGDGGGQSSVFSMFGDDPPSESTGQSGFSFNFGGSDSPDLNASSNQSSTFSLF